MNKTKKIILRIALSGFLLIIGILFLPDRGWLALGIYSAAYLIIAYDIITKAFRNIFRGNLFDENFLMTVATIGAFLIGEYPEGIGVMLFYQVGELLQSRAVNRSRQSIAGLMDIRPDYANVLREGKVTQIDPDEVVIGDRILIKAGERVPLDGVVLEGTSLLDTSALTGEAVPRTVSPGSEILSGCVNKNGLLTVEVMKEYGESTVSKILDLVENAAARKAKTEDFITKFAKYYTPVVVALAVMISLLPPLFLTGADVQEWVYRGLTFLVISCPCALVISIPLSFFGGIGGASAQGILIKGGSYLEALARIDTVVFDKTGTLTKGVFAVQKIKAVGMTERELLEVTAYAEFYSNHPIAESLKVDYGEELDRTRITEAEEIAGYGVKAVVDGRTIYAGNEKLMKKIKPRGYLAEGTGSEYMAAEAVKSGAAAGRTAEAEAVLAELGGGTTVLVAVEGSFAGAVLIADELKEDAREAIQELKRAGVRKTVMLTGDVQESGARTAAALGIDQMYAGLLPGDKVKWLEVLMAEENGDRKLCFVGDGMNDAPVLARADVGIAMGGLGADAAIEAADIVIMTDEPSKIAAGIKIARKTLGIVRQNIGFSLAVKFLVLLLTALGFASMWAGVAADVGVTVLAVLNAARALKAR